MYRTVEAPDIVLPEEDSDVIVVNDTKWTPVDNIDADLNGPKPKLRPRFLFSLVDSDALFGPTTRKPMHYFRLMFPSDIMASIVLHTNNLIKSKCGDGAKGIDSYELYKFLGIRLAMAIDPLYGTKKEYWATKTSDRTIRQPKDYGKRFGMSRDRFEQIEKCLKFGPDGDLNVKHHCNRVLSSLFYVITYRLIHGLMCVHLLTHLMLEIRSLWKLVCIFVSMS